MCGANFLCQCCKNVHNGANDAEVAAANVLRVHAGWEMELWQQTTQRLEHHACIVLVVPRFGWLANNNGVTVGTHNKHNRRT